MRLQLLGVVCLSLSVSSAAQIASTTDAPAAALTQDQQARALIQQVLTASGPIISATSLTATLGTYRSGTDSNLYPVRIYTMGNNRVRSEIDRSGGTSVRILNQGKAVFTSATGQTRRLNMLNTLAERVQHVPVFSSIIDADTNHLQIEYLGTDQWNGISVQKIAVSRSDATMESEQKEFLKRSRVVYTIDPSTYRIVQIAYAIGAEEDSNVMMRYRIVYSDYAAFSGRSIPTTVTTYLNGTFLSELKVTSYTENADVPTASFDLPEVTQ